MASNVPRTDKGLGLGLVFGIVTVVAILLTALNGFAYAVEGAAQLRITSGIAFGIGLLTAGLAIVAIHVFEA